MIAQTKILSRLRKPVLAGICMLLCLLPLLFSTPATGATDNSFPSSFYVTFKGDLQLGQSRSDDTTDEAHAVQFLNGTYYLAKTVLFTFSMEESSNSEYTVKFTLTLDDFYYEVTLPATVSNGRVYIDSTATMFVVNPKDLINDNVIQIFQTEDWSFYGTVMNDDGRPARINTLIEDYHVSSKRVNAFYQQPDGSKSLWTSLLFYDLTTGVLVDAPTYIMDEVLFNKVGVALLYNGNFRLWDYSENLNFTLWDFTDSLNPSIVSKPSNPSPNPSSNGGQSGTTPPSLPWLILIPVVVAVFILVVSLTYKSSKNKKSGRPKTNSHNFLKIFPAYALKKEDTAYEF
ncbi:MAG: hypothetical protein ACFCUE_08410 [Candidatus Bathyarchaeia archaeon]|jgi:hypothetical protein